MSHIKLAKALALALAGIGLFVNIVIGLDELGLTNESHCRREADGRMFASAFDASGVEARLMGGVGEEAGRCVLPRFFVLTGWELPGNVALDLTAATPSTADARDLALPEGYAWVEGGYAIASESLPGRILPPLVPLLGLLTVAAIAAVAWREYYRGDR